MSFQDFSRTSWFTNRRVDSINNRLAYILYSVNYLHSQVIVKFSYLLINIFTVIAAKSFDGIFNVFEDHHVLSALHRPNCIFISSIGIIGHCFVYLVIVFVVSSVALNVVIIVVSVSLFLFNRSNGGSSLLLNVFRLRCFNSSFNCRIMSSFALPAIFITSSSLLRLFVVLPDFFLLLSFLISAEPPLCNHCYVDNKKYIYIFC